MSTTPASWTPRTTGPARGAIVGRRPLLPRPTGRLDGAELRRRAWHMAPGLLPFVLWPISHRDPLSPTLRGVIIGVMVVLTGLLFLDWRRVARVGHGTTDRIAAIYGYAGSVLLTLLLFPAHAECGLAVLAVLAFGDGSATLCGKVFGVRRLPWNPSKSVAGLVGFLLIGLPMTALVYWGESHNLEALGPPATAWQAVFVAAAGVTAAAFAETAVSRINDNIRVGLASAVTIVAAHAVLFGL